MPNGAPKVIVGPHRCLADQGLEFGEGHFEFRSGL